MVPYYVKTVHGEEMAEVGLVIADIVDDFHGEFLQSYWGKRPYASRLSPQVLDRLLGGFADGDVSELLHMCRKADNSKYSAEECQEMERDLDAHGRTLNLPYCFSPGACEIHSAFLDACDTLANDIEVGMYASKAGGDIADWHCDANHNFTIQVGTAARTLPPITRNSNRPIPHVFENQLCGCKEWQTAAKGEVADSRGMLDAPRNRAEQLSEQATAPFGGRRFSLTSGSLLYLPPGEWHRVSPRCGGSLSVDVRLGHLSAAKWLCEVLYASLALPCCRGDHAAIIGTAAASGIGPGGDTQLALHSLGQHLTAQTPRSLAVGAPVTSGMPLVSALLARCPLPRQPPADPELSDGLNRGADLAWLQARGFLAAEEHVQRGNELAVSPAVAVTLCQRDEDSLIVRLVAESPLTTLEYLRFEILCEAELHEPLAALVAAGQARVEQLTSQTSKQARLLVLLRCLLRANVLVVTNLAEPSALLAGGRKRRR